MSRAKVESRLTFFLDKAGKQVKCPKCSYGYCRVIGEGAPEQGMETKLLWLRCGNCYTKFYEYVRTNPVG